MLNMFQVIVRKFKKWRLARKYRSLSRDLDKALLSHVIIVVESRGVVLPKEEKKDARYIVN